MIVAEVDPRLDLVKSINLKGEGCHVRLTSRIQGSTNILQVDGRACEARISADLAC